MKTIIITNGNLEDISAWRHEIALAGLVVAADGGARNARALGIVPHVLVGDADSLNAATAGWLATQGVEIVRHPAEKDETDLDLALLYAAAAGATEIAILGAWGGRPDQALANLYLLTHPRLAGRRVRLLGRGYEMQLVRGGEEAVLAAAPGDTVSLLPLGGKARGIQTAGLRWALSGDMLRLGSTRGVSNQATAPEVRVWLEEGLLLVVHLLAAPAPEGGAEPPGGAP